MPVPAEVESKQQSIEGAPPAPSLPIDIPTGDADSLGSQQDNEVTSNGTTSPASEGVTNGDLDGEKPHKLFVGGLTWSVNEDKLCEVFEQYGEVLECKIMYDPVSKRARGFGFITFKEPDSVTKVLNTHKSEPITIDGKEIDPKVAVPPKRLSNKVKRIFVGGLSSDSAEEDLRNYFEQFGKVAECQLMYDRNTNRHRGFGFVSFESEEPAEKVCSIQYHDIKGKKVEVKVAQTKEALALQQGKGRTTNGRNNFSNYGNFGPSYNQFYPSSPPYPLDFMAMGGYAPAPVLIGNDMRKPHRGGKTQDFSQQQPFPAYMYGGWAEPPRMAGGFYGPAGYGGMPITMIRGHPGMDPNMAIPTSGMDYIADQFQGIALGGGGYPPSPMAQFPPISHARMGRMVDANSTVSPHNLSPKGTVTTASVNGFNSQVPAYTGSHNSYNTAVAQTSY